MGRVEGELKWRRNGENFGAASGKQERRFDRMNRIHRIKTSQPAISECCLTCSSCPKNLLKTKLFRIVVQGRSIPVVVGGDGDGFSVDCGAAADGQLELRLQPVGGNYKCKK
jgi:hypothetical protein